MQLGAIALDERIELLVEYPPVLGADVRLEGSFVLVLLVPAAPEVLLSISQTDA